MHIEYSQQTGEVTAADIIWFAGDMVRAASGHRVCLSDNPESCLLWAAHNNCQPDKIVVLFQSYSEEKASELLTELASKGWNCDPGSSKSEGSAGSMSNGSLYYLCLCIAH